MASSVSSSSKDDILKYKLHIIKLRGIMYTKFASNIKIYKSTNLPIPNKKGDIMSHDN